MADSLAHKGQQNRTHIATDDPREVRYWTKHLKVTTAELREAVDRVGNSAATVRKELASKKDACAKPPVKTDQPPPEEDFGGGDFVSLEQQPSTDDDRPLE